MRVPKEIKEMKRSELEQELVLTRLRVGIFKSKSAKSEIKLTAIKDVFSDLLGDIFEFAREED